MKILKYKANKHVEFNVVMATPFDLLLLSIFAMQIWYDIRKVDLYQPSYYHITFNNKIWLESNLKK